MCAGEAELAGGSSAMDGAGRGHGGFEGAPGASRSWSPRFATAAQPRLGRFVRLFVRLFVRRLFVRRLFVCAQRMVLEKDALGLVQPEPMTAEKAKLDNRPPAFVLIADAVQYNQGR